MINLKSKQIIQDILDFAEIKINGTNPWDIKVHNDKFYQRVLTNGSLGLGESYMEVWWDCEKLDEFFYRILKAKLDEKVPKERIFWYFLKSKLINPQSKSKAFENVKWHYDIGNELYQNMLDKRMAYSCGYWKNTDNLDQAQENKLDLICKKINLKPGMKILDIGCGWGSFLKFAAEKYKVKVIGITLSKEQVKLGKELCKGLPIEIRLQDYRDLNEKFNAVVSVGMFEHVGLKNYKTFMKKVFEILKNDGLFLLHTIGKQKSTKSTDQWIEKYIFPNSILPSAKQIINASEGLFVFEDWHNFGHDYDKTLMAWHSNFKKNWDEIKINYNEKFKRMWNYYLLQCAGAFRSGENQLWQIVFSKKGIKRGYESIR